MPTGHSSILPVFTICGSLIEALSTKMMGYSAMINIKIRKIEFKKPNILSEYAPESLPLLL